MKEKRCCLKEQSFVFPSLCSINAITDGCIVRKSRIHLPQAEKQTDVLRKNQEYIRRVQKKTGTGESKQSLFNVKYFADYKWYNLYTIKPVPVQDNPHQMSPLSWKRSAVFRGDGRGNLLLSQQSCLPHPCLRSLYRKLRKHRPGAEKFHA